MKKIAVLIMLLAGFATASVSQIIYVPTDQPTIQMGMDAATEGDTVLVEEGIYFENIDFTGKPVTLASRFLLDGDTSHISKTVIDGSQAPNPDSASVVMIYGCGNTGAVLSGFTLTGGSGTRTNPDKEVYHAGGIYINGNGALIEHNRITGNVVERDDCGGGGMAAFLSEGDTLIVRHNVISGNEVITTVLTGCGGLAVISAKSARVLVHDNVIQNNKLTTTARYKGVGGGVYLQVDYADHADIRFYNNLVRENELHCQSSQGGGLYIVFSRYTDDPVSDTQVWLYNNVIIRNYSEDMGGGISIWNMGYETLKHNTPVDPVLINNTISGNTASTGSGLFNYDARTLLFNNIIDHGHTNEDGVEIFTSDIDYCFPAPPRWCKDENNGILYTFYNNISGGWPGPGNINVETGQFFPYVFKLGGGNLCVGHGADSVLLDGRWYHAPGEDFYGQLRPYPSAGNRVDLGAVETVFDNSFPYLFEADIYVPGMVPTIQAAIDSAGDGDIILVDPGIYYENINFRGKAVTVTSQFLFDQDEQQIANTIIDGSMPENPDTASVVLMISGEDSTSVLYGMTITGGKGTYMYEEGYHFLAGGGILCAYGGGMIERNIIEANHLPDSKYDTYSLGNGIFGMVENQKTLIIRDNMIRNNHFHGTNNALGAGLCFWGGRILIEGNQISGNSINSQREATGGGITYFGSEREGVIHQVTIRNNFISGNELYCWGYPPHGAGIFIRGSHLPLDLRIHNNIFQNNRATNGTGGGLEVWEADPVICNNTFFNNRALHGREIGAGREAVPVLLNNILWSTVQDEAGEIYVYPNEKADVVAVHNDILGGWPGEGNMDANPMFNPGSLELSENSPCIGTGIETFELGETIFSVPEIDFYGRRRPDPVDSYVDMGAFESAFRNSPPLLSVNFHEPDSLEITSSENGFIYLVPEHTTAVLTHILDSCLLDPVTVNHDSTLLLETSILDNGTYWIYAVNSNGKLSEPYTFLINRTGASDAQMLPEIRLYPNPASDQIYLSFSRTGTYYVEIYSVAGQLMYRKDFAGNLHKIVLTSFQPGIYYLIAKSDGLVWNSKMIKH